MTIASSPIVTFTMATSDGVPIVGLVPYWLASNRFVRFTITKLVPGQNGDPDSWVAYCRDATTGEPDYDTGASLVDNNDGSYTFTFLTDVTDVTGVPYDSTLTHRVAGQIGRYRVVPLEEQNLWYDFVPDGTPLANVRNIAAMTSCNECHDNLVFHGRRFEVEYCVQCHNPDLAEGEGDMSFMIHRIHNSGTFNVLDGGISYAEVTYPQDVVNCRKCHNANDTNTLQADNWRNLPNMQACDGCHDVFGPYATSVHSGPAMTSNEACVQCHTPTGIEDAHMTGNPTENNPALPTNQHVITYELISAAVDGATNDVTIEFKILADGTALDMTNLPAEFSDLAGDVFRYPGFLLAYALPQDGIAEPADWNNLGRSSAQPLSLGINKFSPIEVTSPIGTVTFAATTGINTATITDTASQFPALATLRAVGLQGYLRQDLDNDGVYDASLHATSALVAVTGDTVRREIIDTDKCSACHEWFDGHGGNRVFSFGSDMVCTMCHVPNLSSGGRAIDPANSPLSPEELAIIGTDPLVYPEDAQNMKDMIHGIHASGFRTRAYEHVRGGPYGGYYDWSEVTFPRGASTSNCTLCHLEGTYGLPLTEGVLPTIVRTTGVATGNDPNMAAVIAARDGTALPNATDWVNTPTATSCFYCHTSVDAWGHMTQNGALLTVPDSGPWTNRSGLGGNLESCTICHGPGRVADLNVVHNK